MRIKEITSGSVVIELIPAECLALAEGCRMAVDGRDHYDATELLYDTLHAHFEALALIGAAGAYVRPGSDLLSEWNLGTVQRDWSVKPACKEATRCN